MAVRQPILRLVFSFCAALIATTTLAIEQNPHPFSSAADAARFQTLLKEVRCVVCQNQNLADSNAPLANDLREKIYHFIEAQQSDEEIKNYLVKRYGEFILLRPRLNKGTLLLWTFPFLVLGISIVILMRFVSKRHSKSST